MEVISRTFMFIEKNQVSPLYICRCMCVIRIKESMPNGVMVKRVKSDEFFYQVWSVVCHWL